MKITVFLVLMLLSSSSFAKADPSINTEMTPEEARFFDAEMKKAMADQKQDPKIKALQDLSYQLIELEGKEDENSFLLRKREDVTHLQWLLEIQSNGISNKDKTAFYLNDQPSGNYSQYAVVQSGKVKLTNMSTKVYEKRAQRAVIKDNPKILGEWLHGTLPTKYVLMKLNDVVYISYQMADGKPFAHNKVNIKLNREEKTFTFNLVGLSDDEYFLMHLRGRMDHYKNGEIVRTFDKTYWFLDK